MTLGASDDSGSTSADAAHEIYEPSHLNQNLSCERAVETAPQIASGRSAILGQPRGLATLFLTEMWERFAYYGMRANLVLYMVLGASKGGLGIDDKTASSIYGLYLASGSLLSLLGGYAGDRWIGAQRAVLYGGVLIMMGNLMLSFTDMRAFFLGLAITAVGIGFLKPNITAMVAELYPEGGSRRDAGFSIFYVGINAGTLLGSLLVPVFASRFGWRFGFALPSLGMFLGVTQFVMTRHHLGPCGRSIDADVKQPFLMPIFCLMTVAVVVATLCVAGLIVINPTSISQIASWLIGILAAGHFIYLIFFAGLDPSGRRRVYVMAALFVACAVFWAGIDQAGASLNLFADRYTDRRVFGLDIPAGTFQAVNPLFIIVFAPLLAMVWLKLGQRGMDLPTPAKFGIGLILMGCGFLVMYFASRHVVLGERALPSFLILTYLMHTLGELCLSPVGLSAMTKLAPPRFAGRVIGIWFMATALGAVLAGQLSAEYDATRIETLPELFSKLFWWGLSSGAIMLLLTPCLKQLVAAKK